MVHLLKRKLLHLVVLLVVPRVSVGQYDEIAANFGSTVEEILSLGGAPDGTCTFAFNATKENCDAMIANYEDTTSNAPDCECYNFCEGKIAGCFAKGETPPFFTCNIRQVVAGCQKGADKQSVFSPADNFGKPCPPGFMCSKDKERSCEEVRDIPLQLGLGDVHAGIFCPGYPDRSENGLQMCPAGSYCPDSTTKIPCPAGYYCPHKTAYPYLKCSHCQEGAQTLQRDQEGYIVAAVIAAAIGLFVFYYLLKQHNAEALDKFMELKDRNLDKVIAKIQSAKRQEKLKALQPKLQVIENRLRQNAERIQSNAKDSVRALSVNTDSGKIKFDARRMFDLMDTNGDGNLSYDEINVALELNDLQLREFTRRMNKEAKMPPETDTISREVFVAHFLKTLEQTTHFEPTQNEAAQLFTDILEATGTDSTAEEVPHELLFDSPLADFLSEKQINHLIKRFRSLQEKNMARGLGKQQQPQDKDIEANSGYLGRSSIPDIDTSAVQPRTRRRGTFQWGNRKSLIPPPAGGLTALVHEDGDDDDQSDPILDMSSSVNNGVPLPTSRRRRSTVAARRRRRSSLLSPSLPPDGELPHRNIFKYKRTSIFTAAPKKFETITREEFIAWYPALLTEVLSEGEQEKQSIFMKEQAGVDIAFENLSLTVTVKGNIVKIVDKVTGRLRAGTMTALMGGSGAGKTSLLNALCGRAFYGKVTGTVKINGHKTSIEDHSHAVGFVPQDDIVYAELTVRENFIFSGKFQLPKGTPMEEIEDLADETMASLGLSRVMHSIVGDVTRRGVSGGEKKRVNIGLELMSRPRILFLDEPTSGLDANSALLVMESLKTLVRVQGTTVCSVIHQPRKFIFELFDSLVLLGVGGRLVYHGPTAEAEEYFKGHSYILPKGESIADWLIDISSGRLGPSKEDKNRQGINSDMPSSDNHRNSLESTPEEDTERDDSARPMDLDDFEAMVGNKSEVEMPSREGSGKIFDVDQMIEHQSQSNIASMQSLLQSTAFDAAGGEGLQDEAALAKVRREILYKKWQEHFKSLPDEKKAEYEAPTPYDLPAKVEKLAFPKQLGYQLARCVIVGQRNWTTKVIDTFIIVGATVLVSAMDGTEEPTVPMTLFDVKYDKVAEPTRLRDLLSQFPNLFQYALIANVRNIQTYATKLSVLLAVLTALSGGKALASKRKEFFREAASGYNVNAYMGAVNIMVTIEVAIQCAISGVVALWLRNILAKWTSLLLHFILVGWISTSWALLFPMIVPADNAIMATGFYVVISSLLFSGNASPILYKDIYGSTATAIFCGLFSPARYFIEGMAVTEARCLPGQSGFTELGDNISGEALQVASFKILGLGLNDLGTITKLSTEGWYWGILPAFLTGLWLRWVGAGVIHTSERPQQAKKPFREIMDASLAINIIVYFVVFGCLLGAAIWSMLRVTSSVE